MLIRCYIKVPLIHNLLSYILHNQIFNLSQHTDKVTRKTDYHTKDVTDAQNSDRERANIKEWFFLGNNSTKNI